VAATLKLNGVRPLAWSDQAWQISSVLEVVLLSDGGPALYRDLIVKRNPAAWEDPRVTRALQRLRWLRALSEDAPVNRAWTDGLHALLDGKAAMVISGDWAKGELMAWGASPQREFGCFTAPGTEGMHIFTLDTLAMVKTQRPVQAAQETMAEVLASAATQRAYNQAKGSVPVRRDAPVRDMDVCARDSWETFATLDRARVPSLALTANEATKAAVGRILTRFVTEPDMTPQEAQHKIAMVIQLPEQSAKLP
jgi:glucose/mannose transport system substrate-binding protein